MKPTMTTLCKGRAARNFKTSSVCSSVRVLTVREWPDTFCVIGGGVMMLSLTDSDEGGIALILLQACKVNGRARAKPRALFIEAADALHQR